MLYRKLIFGGLVYDVVVLYADDNFEIYSIAALSFRHGLRRGTPLYCSGEEKRREVFAAYVKGSVVLKEAEIDRILGLILEDGESQEDMISSCRFSK